ncbi:YtxH domain-containing protein [Chitinophaga oryzae]|uniref:YtxH domain-containing protein n=1 Tax=Chitinophaga oryzae TaxID=2725414 RepID=A0AAE6ZJE7_9BACT|nr:YtxH domain-containing protein [Chitinophaga oryzae]QJB32814.1 YtxH domain-containing protein [Chitinophaga oryzae]QJB39267.1 YtxH domain-containing protein [Chitinophaga oryzae]
MSTTKFLAGAIAGLTTGIIIGMLTAPESGDNTRRKIRHTADDWRNKINGMVNRGGEDLSDLKEVFEKEIEGLQDDTRERVLRLINKAQGKYNRFKKEALS